MKRRLKVFLSSLLALVLFNCKNGDSQQGFTNLEPDEFSSAISGKQVQLIDVRTSKEFNEGHIPKAENIDYLSDKFTSEIQNLNKEKPVYIYCRSGKRSSQSVSDFKKAGFTKIYNLQGGILKWETENLSISLK